MVKSYNLTEAEMTAAPDLLSMTNQIDFQEKNESDILLLKPVHQHCQIM
jgi:hypothetical protein